MKATVFLILLIFATCAKKSVQDCRVLADCRGEARWKDISGGPQGRPGKTGPAGLKGQKGEPGLGVNVTELMQHLKYENGDPKLFYYMSTLTYDSSKAFCKQFGRTLCRYDQLCVPNKGGRRLICDAIPGNNWVAILDNYNDWAQLGTFDVWACIRHNTVWPPPSWGISNTESRLRLKGYVFCCEAQPNAENTIPDIRFQFIGNATTYASSQEHCENQGRRLCYSSEACPASTPRFGTRGNNWVAVKDRYNEWIQIGQSGRACRMHGMAHGRPTWGVREDGSLLRYVGFVYCCKKSE